MSQLGSYPLVPTLEDTDRFILSRYSEGGAAKDIYFADLKNAVQPTPPPGTFVASQYNSITNTGNGGGLQIKNALFGGIRGSLTIAADSLVTGSVIRFRFAGYISTSGANRTFQLRLFLQGQQANGDLATGIGSGALSNVLFTMEGQAIVQADGASGALFCQSMMIVGGTIYPQVTTSQVTIDTTASCLIAAETVWSGGSIVDSVTITEAFFELI